MQSISMPSAQSNDEIKAMSERKTQKRVEDAAGQFEALMIGQLLESVTKTGLPGEDSGTSILEMGKDQLAQAISAGGGLGLKKTIMNSLVKNMITPA